MKCKHKIMFLCSIFFFPESVGDRDLHIQHYLWKKIKLASISYEENYFPHSVGDLI